MNALSQFIKQSESRRIRVAVCGDSMIDEYYPVRVNRISPEFPIPVLLSEDDEPTSVVPGGAANVCYQMKYWNTDVYLLTVMTEAGAPIITPHNFNCDYSVTLKNGWRMPRKKRLYDGDFPLDRWDIEAKNQSKIYTAEWSEARSKLLNNFTKLISDINPDIVILSDYGKGIFVGGSENISMMLIDYCNDKNIPIIVDPKTVNSNLWSRCTILKPNIDWAKAFCDKYADHLNHSSIADKMEYIADNLKTQEIVLTDSGNGVGIHNRDSEEAVFLSSVALSKRRPIIRSVIGAGDCFIAFFAMAKALGMNLRKAAEIAFNGSSAYIEDKHNAPVSPYRFQKWFDPIGAKKVSLDKLLAVKKQTPNKTWVWTNGCFDIMHAGHLKTFEEAKKLGDKLIVGINTDESVKMLKGSSRPILSYHQREELIANLQHVDFVIPISDEKPGGIIRQLLPDIIVKGGDYKVEDIDGWEVVDKDNVHIVPLVHDMSTSKIIERIKNA